MTKANLPVRLRFAGDFPATWAELRRLAAQGAPVGLQGLGSLAPEEAQVVLEFFLHDASVSQPIEPFASLLAALTRREELALWDLLAGEGPDEATAQAFLETLPRDHPQCFECASFPVCQGFGAWAKRCETWRGLIAGLAAAARDLARLQQCLHRSIPGDSHDRL